MEAGSGRLPLPVPQLPAVISDPCDFWIRASQPFQEILMIFGMMPLKQPVPQLHFLLIKPYFSKQGNPCLHIHFFCHRLAPFVLYSVMAMTMTSLHCEVIDGSRKNIDFDRGNLYF